jgi:hypothetical protein
VTDIAPGHDHITSAIGAASVGWHDTSMLRIPRRDMRAHVLEHGVGRRA